VPSTLLTYNAFTLKTLPEEAEFVAMAAAEVPTACTAVLPVMVATLTMLGAVIYPNTIAIAIAFPVKSSDAAPINTTADPLRLIAASELLLSLTVRDRVVPELV
jgi:hypothetical protein